MPTKAKTRYLYFTWIPVSRLFDFMTQNLTDGNFSMTITHIYLGKVMRKEYLPGKKSERKFVIVNGGLESVFKILIVRFGRSVRFNSYVIRVIWTLGIRKKGAKKYWKSTWRCKNLIKQNDTGEICPSSSGFRVATFQKSRVTLSDRTFGINVYTCYSRIQYAFSVDWLFLYDFFFFLTEVNIVYYMFLIIIYCVRVMIR